VADGIARGVGHGTVEAIAVGVRARHFGRPGIKKLPKKRSLGKAAISISQGERETHDHLTPESGLDAKTGLCYWSRDPAPRSADTTLCVVHTQTGFVCRSTHHLELKVNP